MVSSWVTSTRRCRRPRLSLRLPDSAPERAQRGLAKHNPPIPDNSHRITTLQSYLYRRAGYSSRGTALGRISNLGGDRNYE